MTLHLLLHANVGSLFSFPSLFRIRVIFLLVVILALLLQFLQVHFQSKLIVTKIISTRIHIKEKEVLSRDTRMEWNKLLMSNTSTPIPTSLWCLNWQPSGGAHYQQNRWEEPTINKIAGRIPLVMKLISLVVRSSWWLSSYTSKWSRDVEGRQQLVFFLFWHPLLNTVFFLITVSLHV